MEFNQLNRVSSKWRRFPSDVLPMHVAEMDFEVAPEIRALLIDMASRSDLGYLGPIPEVQEAFAGFAKSRWGWDLTDSTLKIATDVGVATVELLRVITSPGDRILVNYPVYSAFQPWIKEVGCVAHNVPLIRDGETWKLDIAGIEKAFEAGVRVYLLCSPQNPVGRIHSRQELSQIADLAKKYGVIVIADEIHAPLSFSEFTPFLAVSQTAREVGVAITSSSKAWNTAGLKAAFLVAQSQVMQEKLKAMPEGTHWRSSILGGFAMATSFRDATGWLDETLEKLRSNYQFLLELLESELPKAKVANCEATYLAWIDLSAYGKDKLVQRFLDQGRVSLVGGEDHAENGDYNQFVRLNFATSQDHIREAVRRMRLTLES